ncbi:hypothetical protein FS837_008725 [Tulasnella sp. UAMH 9824]|nr:hypothetical protein FS837_008725 [Tulasnella sp. UAMH 9824]
MVCRAWRDAVDNTPELTQYILVNGWSKKKNIEYVQRNNCDGPVEVLLDNAELPTRNELSSLLGPLACRLRSVDTSSTNLTIEPAPFPMLRALRIHSVYQVPYTFTSDLLGVLHANPDLVELYVGHVQSEAPGADPPRLRIDHSGLQRVQLTQLSGHILSPILHCLGLKSSVMLIVDEMRLEDVRTSGSATADLIRSLQRTAFSAFGVQLQGDGTADNQRAVVTFRHAVHDNTVLHWGPNPGSRATSEWIQLDSGNLTYPDAVDMVRFIRDSGIEQKSARLAYGWDGMPIDLLHYLSPVTRLLLEGDKMWSVLQQLGQPLPRDPESADEPLRFLCPHLTVLDLKYVTGYGVDPSSAWSELRLVIQSRQRAARVAKGHAKLQRIGLQRALIEEHDFSDPVFEGIEIYELTY